MKNEKYPPFEEFKKDYTFQKGETFPISSISSISSNINTMLAFAARSCRYNYCTSYYNLIDLLLL